MRFFFLFFLTLGPLCAGIAFLTMVRPLRLGRAARIALGVALLVCSLKFTWFGVFGGHIFLPELPAGVIHALSVVYDFVLVLAVIGVVWACGRLVGRLARRARPTDMRLARKARPTDLARRRMELLRGSQSVVALEVAELSVGRRKRLDVGEIVAGEGGLDFFHDVVGTGMAAAVHHE